MNWEKFFVSTFIIFTLSFAGIKGYSSFVNMQISSRSDPNFEYGLASRPGVSTRSSSKKNELNYIPLLLGISVLVSLMTSVRSE